ncbi:MAG: hypothetical protein ACOVSW_16420 [Candidatus Kapaibacteriota bacterium]
MKKGICKHPQGSTGIELRGSIGEALNRKNNGLHFFRTTINEVKEINALDKHFTTLHGYSLCLVEEGGKSRLSAPSEALSCDGRAMNWLNAALSAIRVNPQLYHQTRFGEGFADQWGGCFLYSDQEAAMIQNFRQKYREAFGRECDSPIWVIGSDADDCLLLPQFALYEILDLFSLTEQIL